MAGADQQGRSFLSPPVRLIGALVALALALWARALIFERAYWALGTPILVAACFLAALLAGRPRVEAAVLPAEFAPRGTRLSTILGWAVALSGLAVFGWTTWALVVAWQRNFDWAAPLMVGGVALSSGGLALVDRRWRSRAAREPVTAPEITLLLTVLALGTFLRFYKIEYFPPLDGFVAIEEPQSGQGAWAIMTEGVRPWEFLLDRWIPVPFFHWLGVSILSLRIPFVIVSCFTLLATYILARELVRWPAALTATTLLAVSHWHLHYARLAHNIFPTTLLSVIVWWLCIRQANTGGLRLYPWIGFWSGYSLYAYAGYRGIPVVVSVFLLGHFLHQWWIRNRSPADRTAWKVLLGGLALVVIFFSGPVLVLANQLRNNPTYFLEAFFRSYANKQYYVSDWPTWLRLRWERLIDTAKIFHHFGDTEQAYNLPGEPMLDPVSGVLFTTALFFCLLYPRQRYQGFFAFAFLFLLLAGATLTQTLVVARLQIVVPLVFVLVALWAQRMWELSSEAHRAWAKWTWAGTIAAFALAAGILNWNIYFGKMIHNQAMRAVYRNYYTTAITYLHSLPDDGYLVLFSDMRNFFIPSDYAWWRGTRVPGEVSTDIYPLLVGSRGAWNGRSVHVLLQRPFEQEDLADLLRAYQPAASCEWIRHPEGYPHLDQIACVAGRNLEPKVVRSGLRVRYIHPKTQELLLERNEPAISWALLPEICSRWHQPDKPGCIVEWQGEFFLDGEQPRELAVEARNARVEGHVDERNFSADRSVPIEGYLLGGEMSAARLSVEPGNHRIVLRAEPSTNDNDLGVRLRWKDPLHGWRLVPFDRDRGGSAVTKTDTDRGGRDGTGKQP
ncbi:MAG: hypothetical protein KatS3mg077_1749 [Candidatus Binatia bacterium]|nr:MAG: hypothetical protein KatS3mg077_1749 [Candidatus Binatia bacterium]